MKIRLLTKEEQKKIEPCLNVKGRPTQYSYLYYYIRSAMSIGEVLEVTLPEANKFFGRNIQATFRQNRVPFRIIATRVNNDELKWCVKKIRRSK
jgi:hypothetical protein